MNIRPALISLLILFTYSSGFAAADSTEFYFYRHPDYGSQSVFNPATVFLNGGFDVIQTGSVDPDPFNLPFYSSAKNVFMNIGHPFRQIGRHGWGKFLSEEVIPTSLSMKQSQYVPNYTLHLLGGGVTYRTLWEWSEAHQVPYPRFSAMVFTAAYHFMNEITENGSFTGVNTDPIADLCIFDPLSILLFQSDKVARFLGTKAIVSDWSTMPFFDPAHKVLDNTSQNYALSLPLPKTERLRLFAYLGMNELCGLSWRRGNGYAVSGGGGVTVNSLAEVDTSGASGRTMTITYTWNTGFFFDKDNSLLFSVLLSGNRFYRARLNLYPLPDFHFENLRPAFFAAIGQKDELVLGVTANWLPLSLSARAP